MKFTIIVPHYNSTKSLKKLMESIPQRTDIQILIIDDKSEDKEVEELKKIIKINTNIQLILNDTEKKGAGVCRNLGLNQAIGKWIIFADSDDFFTKNIEEILIKYMEFTDEIIYFKSESCFGDTLEIADRDKPFNMIVENYLSEPSEERLDRIRIEFMVPWSKMIKRDFIEKNSIKFDEVIAANDVMFSLKSGYLAQKIHVSNDIFYCITVTRGSLTKRFNKEIFEARFSVHQRKNEFLKINNKKQYVRPGLSYLIKSRKFGVKYFFKILFKIIKYVPYIVYSSKDWDIKKMIFGKEEDKKYFIDETKKL